MFSTSSHVRSEASSADFLWPGSGPGDPRCSPGGFQVATVGPQKTSVGCPDTPELPRGTPESVRGGSEEGVFFFLQYVNFYCFYKRFGFRYSVRTLWAGLGALLGGLRVPWIQ